MNTPHVPGRDLDPSVLAQRREESGASVLYLHKTLYPVLSVDVVLLERSRDEMGKVETTILGLCAHGVKNARQIAFAMGLKPHRLSSLLAEVEHRGLVHRQTNDDFVLSDLGRMSLDHGGEVVRTSRALLLCGLTGRLLPAETYEAPLLRVADLGERPYRSYNLLPEAESLSLEHVRLEGITDRRAVNLPDETIAIEGIVADSLQPRFLRGVLMLVRGADQHERCEVHLTGVRAPIDWLATSQALGLLEPLGFPFHSPDDIVSAIYRELQDLGVLAGASRLDRFGNPAFEIAEVRDSFFAARIANRSLVLKVGVNGFAAVPMGSFPAVAGGARRPDVLRGRTLVVTARPGSAFARQVNVARVLETAGQAHRRSGSREPRGPALRRALERAGHRLAEAQDVARLIGLSWLQEGLDTEDPSAADL